MKSVLFLILLVFAENNFSAQDKAGISAKIITETNSESLKIRGNVKNESTVHYDLNYILISIKKGSSGSSSNKQSGKFSIAPNEVKVLSESTFNITAKDALKVFLLIKDEHSDRLVAKDSLALNGKQFQDNVSFIPEADLELTGLTVDDTKTRVGQTFYGIFFRKYSQYLTKFEGSIIISELPSFGRSSRILISKNDELIYSFQSKPDEDFLEDEASKALALVLEYSANNNLRNREFKY